MSNESTADESKLKMWSLGIVAANKPRNSTKIEVFPKEQFPMSGGEVTDHYEELDVKGTDSAGKPTEGKIKTTPSITADWYPLGEPHRVTAPDVRRNEEVLIFKFADSQDSYRWCTLSNNVLRRLETITWWFSGTPLEADTSRNGENGYVFEVSTHDKHIILTTSKKNGEKALYRIQIDTGNGNLTIIDDLGQTILLDSVAGLIEMIAENLIHLKTKRIHFECEQFQVDASQSVDFNTPTFNVSDDMNVGGKSVFAGRSNFQGGIGGKDPGNESSALDFFGSVTQQGDWTLNGQMQVNGGVEVTGDLHAANVTWG